MYFGKMFFFFLKNLSFREIARWYLVNVPTNNNVFFIMHQKQNEKTMLTRQKIIRDH